VCFQFFSTANWALEECKNQAQRAVEIRERYKTYDRLRAAVEVGMAKSDGLSGANRAINDNEVRTLQLEGELVFKHSKGLKGPKLYKYTYDDCMAFNKK